VFRAFTDENRIRVLTLLGDDEQCACVLLEDVKISQPTLSHHMKILCDSGIVKSRREGKWHYYSLNADGCRYGIRLLDALIDRMIAISCISPTCCSGCAILSMRYMGSKRRRYPLAAALHQSLPISRAVVFSSSDNQK
jgi:ArsR family transcriptional regulator